MKFVIKDSLALSRPPEGPIASYIVPFAGWLIDRGYGIVSLRNRVLMAVGFSKWLRQKGIELRGIGAEHPERYLLDRAHYRRPKLGDSARLFGIYWTFYEARTRSPKRSRPSTSSEIFSTTASAVVRSRSDNRVPST